MAPTKKTIKKPVKNGGKLQRRNRTNKKLQFFYSKQLSSPSWRSETTNTTPERWLPTAQHPGFLGWLLVQWLESSGHGFVSLHRLQVACEATRALRKPRNQTVTWRASRSQLRSSHAQYVSSRASETVPYLRSAATCSARDAWRVGWRRRRRAHLAKESSSEKLLSTRSSRELSKHLQNMWILLAFSNAWESTSYWCDIKIKSYVEIKYLEFWFIAGALFLIFSIQPDAYGFLKIIDWKLGRQTDHIWVSF